MKSFLHIGCGIKRKNQTTTGFNTNEWQEIRFDIDESNQPDLIGTMLDMKAVASDSMDALYSSHNIEHLYPHEVQIALKEFLRILKPDGYAVITCPDIQSVCALVAEDKLTDAAYMSVSGAITPLDILYGHGESLENGNVYMAHKTGFTKKTLSTELQKAGFAIAGVIVKRESFFNLWAIASKKLLEREELIGIMKEHGIVN
jgi:ubiquinone/menaquinone biosynthesis C-methylase UbiE